MTAIQKFVQQATFQLYRDFVPHAPVDFRNLVYNNAVEQFVQQLRNTGAKVYINKHDYFFSEAFGPISERLRGKTRKQIRKSLAFLRIREYSNYHFRARIGVAGHAALFLSKNDMIQLQLINQCRFARLFISAEDIFSSFEQADKLMSTCGNPDGYYVSGPVSLIHTPFNIVRTIPRLTVYITQKDAPGKKIRTMF